MAIKGISEVRRLPRIGVIRLGEKRKSAGGKEYPAKLDYFNLKDAPGVGAIFGDKPRSIEIMLPHENPDFFFSQWRKAYGKSGLFCRGNGETARRVRLGLSDGKDGKVTAGQPLDAEGERIIKEQKLDVKVGAMFDLPCAGESCPYTIKKLCRPLGQLLFLIPKVPAFGCYQISTTSFNTMVELNSYIDAVRNVAGRISMIPLTLSLVPKKVTIPGTRESTTIFHLKLEYKGAINELVRYRDTHYIAADLLPKLEHIEREVPEDHYPDGGEQLDRQLGQLPPPAESQPDPEPEPQEPPPPPPPAAEPQKPKAAQPAPAKKEEPKPAAKPTRALFK